MTFRQASKNKKRRPANSQAPLLHLQDKPYLTGSPPSRQMRRYRQGVECPGVYSEVLLKACECLGLINIRRNADFAPSFCTARGTPKYRPAPPPSLLRPSFHHGKQRRVDRHRDLAGAGVLRSGRSLGSRAVRFPRQHRFLDSCNLSRTAKTCDISRVDHTTIVNRIFNP